MSDLAQAVKGGKFVVTGECHPPRGADAAGIKECATRLNALVDAVNVIESEDGPRMSSLAACGHVLEAGAEPILHILTRDLNRIALQSTLLGAASMGIRNILCLAGKHQTLTSAGDARGVYDIDPLQLVQVADTMRRGGRLSDGEPLDAPVEMLLGVETNPFSDPLDLQVITLDRAAALGADFVITQPVFNTNRFEEWMGLVRARGIHEKMCVIASVMPLESAEEASAMVAKFRGLDIPDTSAVGADSAAKTAAFLKGIEGVRGIHVMGGNLTLALEVLKGLK